MRVNVINLLVTVPCIYPRDEIDFDCEVIDSGWRIGNSN
jgi:hypothetical protein